MTRCECCVYYDFDENDGDYVCTVDMDEDEYARFLAGDTRECPYWKYGDDYETARRQ